MDHRRQLQSICQLHCRRFFPQMGRDQIFPHTGEQPLRHQCRCHADHAIQHDGHMPQSSADAHTGQPGNIQPSDCLQYREGIRMPQIIGFQGGAHHLLLPRQSLIRQSRASAGDFLCPTLQKSSRHCTASGGVTDSHFPGGKDAVSLFLTLPYQFDSCDNGTDGLFFRHGRFF